MSGHYHNDEITLEVTVSRTLLLERLKAAREKHMQEYQRALESWRTELAHQLANVDPKKCFTFPQTLRNLSDDCPTSYLLDYDRAIDMFSMGLNDEIKLDSESFNRFCRDEWDWKSSLSRNRYYRMVSNN